MLLISYIPIIAPTRRGGEEKEERYGIHYDKTARGAMRRPRSSINGLIGLLREEKKRSKLMRR